MGADIPIEEAKDGPYGADDPLAERGADERKRARLGANGAAEPITGSIPTSLTGKNVLNHLGYAVQIVVCHRRA